MSKVTSLCFPFFFLEGVGGVTSQKWQLTETIIAHHVCAGGIRPSSNPSVLLALVNHNEQRLTHSGRAYLQLELISGPEMAAPGNPFLVCLLR